MIQKLFNVGKICYQPLECSKIVQQTDSPCDERQSKLVLQVMTYHKLLVWKMSIGFVFQYFSWGRRKLDFILKDDI